ncbi:synaptojanin [Pancytospora philotis]|nr:synaptojanin [Pancytospora philotis]
MGQLHYSRQTRGVRYDTPSGTVSVFHSSSASAAGVHDADAATYPLHAVLGILETVEGSYLFFVTDAELAGETKGGSAYRILGVEYVTLSGADPNPSADGIKELIENNHFYYCFDPLDDEFSWNNHLIKVFNSYCSSAFHLLAAAPDASAPPERHCFSRGSYSSLKTPSLRKSAVGPKKTKLDALIKSSCRAEAPQSPVSSSSASVLSETIVVKHSSPAHPNYVAASMFCGYLESRVCQDGSTYRLTIQSLISNRKIGTRFLSRGVDESGNASFLVETRFRVASELADEEFVIIRGSVPLFWTQDDPLRPQKLQIDGADRDAAKAFGLHFEELERKYGRVVVVDLLGSRKYERILSQLYRDVCHRKEREYVHIDVNKHTGDFEQLKELLFAKIKKYKLEEITGVHPAAEPGLAVLPGRDRPVTFRVNCLDCLDRTNLVQSLIFGYFLPYNFGAINQMWKNNGNALSKLYTGSDALKADLATKGKLSMMGRVNDLIISANRMIKNTFSDQDKQRSIDILLGHF